MRRAFAGVLLAGLVAIVVHLAGSDGDKAFQLNVQVSDVAATLERGDRACQRDVSVPEAGEFRQISTGMDSDAPVRVLVSILEEGRVRTSGMLGAAEPRADPLDDVRRRAQLAEEVPGGVLVDVCFTNQGSVPAEIIGGPFAASSRTYAQQGEAKLAFDLDLVFYCGCDRSMLGRVGGAIENASVFKIDGAGRTFGIVLLLIVLIGVTNLCVVALRDDEQTEKP